jgi:uncharacterized protein YndB with AHSA1/START domain
VAHIEIAKFIAAPTQAVWDVLADLEHQAAWMVDVHELTIASETKSGVGTVLRVTSELFGQPVVKDVMEITAWDPPRRMDVAHRGQFHGTGSFVLEPVENGTIFTWVEDFRPPFGPLGEAGFALVVRPHLLRVFARSLENVRRLAEAQAVEAGRVTPGG